MAELGALWRSLRQRYWAALMFDVAVILAIFWTVHAWNTRDLPDAAAVPRLEARQLDGNGAIEGLPETGPGVVYFFAPWCFYCRHSIGHIDELVESGEVAWARAVALDYAHPGEVRAFVGEVGLEAPVLLGDARVAREWNIRVFPSYFVMGADGGIESRSVGYATKTGLLVRARLAR
jgi:thiol-disulfide isomerase/thioredoxin